MSVPASMCIAVMWPRVLYRSSLSPTIPSAVSMYRRARSSPSAENRQASYRARRYDSYALSSGIGRAASARLSSGERRTRSASTMARETFSWISNTSWIVPSYFPAQSCASVWASTSRVVIRRSSPAFRTPPSST